MTDTDMQRTQTSQAALEKRLQTAVTPEAMDQGVYYTPLVDIIETDEAFLFLADMPGVKAQDLDVTFENGALTIKGRVHPCQPEDRQYLWREYGTGNYYRSFTIDTPVNPDGIAGELRDGQLKLHVPKAAVARTHKIEIKGD